MPKRRDHILVLWGEQFEELPATIFITKLRKVGFPVKVVALMPNRSGINGAYGLGLVPDLTLDEALNIVDKTRCLIVPYPLQYLNRFASDPRLSQLFSKSQANKVMFILKSQTRVVDSFLDMSLTKEDILVYPADEEDLIRFTEEIIAELTPGFVKY